MPAPHPTQTPEEQLVAALCQKYRVRLTAAQVQFGVPTLLFPDVEVISDPTIRNSSVEVTHAPGEPYEFATMLHFNRLSLASLFLNRNKTFSGDIDHTHELLPELSNRLGFVVRTNDLIGHPIDVEMGYPLNVLLRAAPGSLLLYDQIEVTLSGP